MGLAGIEPATSPLSGVRSNRLSYSPAGKGRDSIPGAPGGANPFGGPRRAPGDRAGPAPGGRWTGSRITVWRRPPVSSLSRLSSTVSRTLPIEPATTRIVPPMAAARNNSAVVEHETADEDLALVALVVVFLELGALGHLRGGHALAVGAHAGDEALELVDRAHRPAGVVQQGARHQDDQAEAEVEQRGDLEHRPRVDRPQALVDPQAAARGAVAPGRSPGDVATTDASSRRRCAGLAGWHGSAGLEDRRRWRLGGALAVVVGGTSGVERRGRRDDVGAGTPPRRRTTTRSVRSSRPRRADPEATPVRHRRSAKATTRTEPAPRTVSHRRRRPRSASSRGGRVVTVALRGWPSVATPGGSAGIGASLRHLVADLNCG